MTLLVLGKVDSKTETINRNREELHGDRRAIHKKDKKIITCICLIKIVSKYDRTGVTLRKWNILRTKILKYSTEKTGWETHIRTELSYGE